MNTRILLADDHTILREGLARLINDQPEMSVIGEAGNGLELLEQAQKLTPDMVLLDLNMPEMDGLAALPKLKTLLPDTKVLILTMHEDIGYLQEAMRNGASGYVLKKVVHNELIEAIRTVLRGEPYVHPAMTGKLVESMMHGGKNTTAEHDLWKSLSERELEVLRLVALGYTNSEVAGELFLSVKTVETYRARGMEKLELETRAQLVRQALEKGLLD